MKGPPKGSTWRPRSGYRAAFVRVAYLGRQERGPVIASLLDLGRRPRQRFHDLRHACATLLLKDGEEPGVIDRILRHADFSTTANT